MSASILASPSRDKTPLYANASERYLSKDADRRWSASCLPPPVSRAQQEEFLRKMERRRQQVEASTQSDSSPSSQHRVTGHSHAAAPTPVRAAFSRATSAVGISPSLAKRWPPRQEASQTSQGSAPASLAAPSYTAATAVSSARQQQRRLSHGSPPPPSTWVHRNTDGGSVQVQRCESNTQVASPSAVRGGGGGSVTMPPAQPVTVTSVPHRARRFTAPAKADEAEMLRIEQLRIRSPDKELQNANEEREKLRLAVAKAQLENAELKAELSKLFCQVRHQGDQYTHLQNEMQRQHENLQRQREGVKMYEAQISSERQQILRIQSEKELLQRECDEYKAAKDLESRWQRQEQALQREIAELKNSLCKCEADRSLLEANNAELARAKCDLQGVLEKQEERISELLQSSKRQEPASPNRHQLGKSARENSLQNQGDACPAAESEDCATRLRNVMTKQNASSDELEQAIASVQALLGEAQRELARKQLRDKRAAYEWLHRAIEAGDEEDLARALAEARRTDVAPEDVQKGDAKLEELRSMTDEQRAEKALHEIYVEKKRLAFLFVKRDSIDDLKDLLDNLEVGLRWPEWKDHNARSLWQFAKELKAEKVLQYLAPALDVLSPTSRARYVPTSPKSSHEAVNKVVEQHGEPDGSSTGVPTVDSEPATESSSTATTESARTEFPPGEVSRTLEQLPVLSPDEETELKTKSFRAVVKDDAATLAELIDNAPIQTWSAWRNKADKDLLTLAEERGSSNAYGLLARRLGLTQEAKRHTFEEREAVWVHQAGEVQPLRATVLEDTPEEADYVLVEFWDGDEPPKHVERCLILKSHYG